MKDKINGVDMDAAIKYMVANDCRLDEAIKAVSGLSDRVSGRKATTPVKSSKTVSDRVVVSKMEKPKTRLKAARLKAGLSQSELAEKASLNLRTLQAYEQGKKTLDNANLATILKIALACGCVIEEILEQEDPIELVCDYMKFLRNMVK